MSSSRPATELASATVADRCREFMATSQVGVGVEAKIGLHALACWNGRRAYEVWGLNDSDCGQFSSIIATVTTERCVRAMGADGTLHFTYRVRVSPVMLPFVGRELTVALVLDRSGHVVRFP
jgi:hypothetical protein